MRANRLRRWLAELHMTPEERRAARAESCLELLFDPERARGCSVLAEHEEAAIEAERRRWAAMHEPAPPPP